MKKKILIVEDDLINMLIISELLKNEFLLFHALNFDVALELIKFIKFDASVVDLHLGTSDKNGIDVLEALKKYQSNQICNIGISSSIRPQDKSQMLEVGYKTFMQKPLVKEELITTIKNHLLITIPELNLN